MELIGVGVYLETGGRIRRVVLPLAVLVHELVAVVAVERHHWDEWLVPTLALRRRRRRGGGRRLLRALNICGDVLNSLG